LGSGGLHGGDVDGDLDGIADEESAGLEDLVLGEAEVLAIDLPARLEGHPDGSSATPSCHARVSTATASV
jgi:hypothetical protein